MRCSEYIYKNERITNTAREVQRTHLSPQTARRGCSAHLGQLGRSPHLSGTIQLRLQHLLGQLRLNEPLPKPLILLFQPHPLLLHHLQLLMKPHGDVLRDLSQGGRERGHVQAGGGHTSSPRDHPTSVSGSPHHRHSAEMETEAMSTGINRPQTKTQAPQLPICCPQKLG